MKILLHLATTINGYIADINGNEDIFSETSWNRFLQLAKKYGNVVWGSKTYDKVLTFEKRYLKEIDTFTKIILSKQNRQKYNDNIVLCNEIDEVLEYAKQNNISHLLIGGGATVNSEFIKRGLIDEIILSINPIILSNGIPMIKNINQINQTYDIKSYGKYDDILEVILTKE